EPRHASFRPLAPQRPSRSRTDRSSPHGHTPTPRRRHHVRHHATRRHGFLVSACSYTDPASAACGSVPPADSRRLRYGGALEDRGCTPGAIDPRVTQADIHSTICVSGYTSKVRPPYSYTAPLESELLRSYGLSVSPAKTELDHLISLELGGAPADPRNLFPEPYAGRRGAT